MWSISWKTATTSKCSSEGERTHPAFTKSPSPQIKVSWGFVDDEFAVESCAFSDIGIELGNGVFVNAVQTGGVASRVGVEPGHRIVHVNNVPVYDAKHAEQLIRCKVPFCFLMSSINTKELPFKSEAARLLLACWMARNDQILTPRTSPSRKWRFSLRWVFQFLNDLSPFQWRTF